jgi:hypothetical protein
MQKGHLNTLPYQAHKGIVPNPLAEGFSLTRYGETLTGNMSNGLRLLLLFPLYPLIVTVTQAIFSPRVDLIAIGISFLLLAA